MSPTNKLSIEDIEKIRMVMNMKCGEKFHRPINLDIALEQLLDTLRENQIFRQALKNIAAATGGEEWEGDVLAEAVSFEAETALQSCKHRVVEKE